MDNPINIAKETEIVFAMILGAGVVLYLIGWIWPLLSSFLASHWPVGQKCEECGKTLYPCKVCGCSYDDAGASASCAEWDKIIKHDCHLHHEHADMSTDLRPEEKWLQDHPEVEEMYHGKMVAVKVPQGIVAVGDTVFELCLTLKEENIPISHTLFIRI